MGSRTRRLLERVADRQGIVSLGRRFHVFVLVIAGIYALLLLVSRLSGLIPDLFEWRTLLMLVGAALLLALVSRHQPMAREAAHVVDKRMDTRDLYLTTVLIEHSLGAYKPLVLRQAEEQASSIQPQKVVPYRWGAEARNVASALALVLAGVLFLPQLDPFGKEQERQRQVERRGQLDQSRKAAALRTAALVSKREEGQLAKQVQKAIEELKQTFQQAKPVDREANLQRLIDRQKELGQLWRKASEEKLKNALSQIPTAQRFGAGDMKKMEDWKQAMERGDAGPMKKELAELKELVDELAKQTEGSEGAELKKQIEQRLDNLADFAASEMNWQPLAGALARAMEQLEMSGLEGLGGEALKGLKESLDLVDLELADLAELMQDVQALEDALEALQLAKALNLLEGLDGGACAGCKGIGEYAALYAKLLGIQRRIGPGMRGPGVGEGGIAPEDPTLQTSYKPERSKSALTAGKVLLSWKTRELSDPGQAKEEYLEYLEKVKHGVREAILHEQVPPGYHEAIRKYFDTMEETHVEPSEG